MFKGWNFFKKNEVKYQEEMQTLVKKPVKPKIVYLWSLNPSAGFTLYCEEPGYVYFTNQDYTVWEVYEKLNHQWMISNGVMKNGRMYPPKRD